MPVLLNHSLAILHWRRTEFCLLSVCFKMAGIALPIYPEFILCDDPTVTHKWKEWLDGLEIMLDAMLITETKHKLSMLLYYLGSDARKVLKTFSADNQSTFEKAKKALTDNFSPKMNDVFLMTGLYREKQDAGESMDNFYRKVLRKADCLRLETKEPKAIKELIILTQLVNNCSNSSLKKKAIRDAMSLTKFLDEARTIEQTEFQFNQMGESENWGKEVNRLNMRKSNGDRRTGSHESSRRGLGSSSSARPDHSGWNNVCERCGYAPHASPSSCPANGQSCNRCGKSNHFSRVCKSQPSKEYSGQLRGKGEVKMIDELHSTDYSDDNYYQEQDDVATQSDDDAYIFMTQTRRGQHPVADLTISETKLSCIIDTGAQVNILDMTAWKKLGKPRLLLPSKQLYAYGAENSQREIPVVGRCIFKVTSDFEWKMLLRGIPCR